MTVDDDYKGEIGEVEWPDHDDTVDDKGLSARPPRRQRASLREWEREAVLVQLIEACVYCDGAAPAENVTLGGEPYLRHHCEDCGETWITPDDQ